MIIEHCEQGTPEWHQCRLGIPTASEVDKILTPTLKASGQQDAYINTLTAEWIAGEPDDEAFVGYWMDRGTELEPEARETIAFETGLTIDEVGFVYKDEDRMVGCSPDGLIHDPIIEQFVKGAELKCPKKINHLSYAVAGVCPKKYIPQVQSSMWICDIDTWIFGSYHPAYGAFYVEVERDEKWSKALDDAMPEFIERVLKARESDLAQRLRALTIASQEAGGVA